MCNLHCVVVYEYLVFFEKSGAIMILANKIVFIQAGSH